MDNKQVGHVFLAKLGKKRLRPGGKKATNFLLNNVDFENKKILEVACNMATTSIELAKKHNCQIIGIDLDKNALDKASENIKKNKLEHKISLEFANAAQLPFENNSFDIIINEAMLTMQQDIIRNKCLEEYYRVLKPNGILLTHDIAIKNENNIINELSDTINVKVNPIRTKEWLNLFESHNLKVIKHLEGKMSLLSPIGLIRDEGLINAIRIVKNGLKPENKAMFKSMFNFFKKNKKNLEFIAIISQKK